MVKLSPSIWIFAVDGIIRSVKFRLFVVFSVQMSVMGMVAALDMVLNPTSPAGNMSLIFDHVFLMLFPELMK